MNTNSENEISPPQESVERTKTESGHDLPGEAANYTTIYLVRHGQTEWNLQDILQGHLDSALTETGLRQARELVERFKDAEFEAIFSSDVTRARRTAETVALEKKLIVKTSQLLRERNWGRYDGRKADIFREECRELIEKFHRLPREEQWKFKYFDDIESFAEIHARFLTFLRETAVAYRGKNILIVSHLDVLGSTLISLGKAPRGIGNMAWIKLLSDGVNLVLADTNGIDF